MQLVTSVRLYRRPYTICYVSEEGLVIPDTQCCKLLGIECGYGDYYYDSGYRNKLKFVATAFFLRPFVQACINSDEYRYRVLLHLHKLCGFPEDGVVFLKLILEPPDKEIIDYGWNDRMLRLIWTRVEIENAFSWLSTLGGAYSALGDYFEHCAEEAGRISIRQYKLSKMLGDEGLAARSKLYSALSYSQKGKIKLARHIVRNVAEFGRATKDKRLIRMCQGVWAKLKYLRSLKKKQVGDATCDGDVLMCK
ncbi:uncharacterized protein F58A4.6 [Ostrinia nubilalis]|uniref:uncharacterized protein F58A4.6 n=1 Tax=Ostrinia nubilalis TaxID=29057 RepID=UPI0030825DB2